MRSFPRAEWGRNRGRQGARNPAPRQRYVPALVKVQEAPQRLERGVGMAEGHHEEERPRLSSRALEGKPPQPRQGAGSDLLVVVEVQVPRAGACPIDMLEIGPAGHRPGPPVRRPAEVSGEYVGGQAFLEPVQLIGAQEVQLPGGQRFVPGPPEVMHQGRCRGGKAPTRCRTPGCSAPTCPWPGRPGRERTAASCSRRCGTRPRRMPAGPDGASGPPGGPGQRSRRRTSGRP